MSQPSQWPLTFGAVRYVTPRFMLEHLANNPLSRACYPVACGYYPRANGHWMQRQQHDDNLLIYCAEGKGHVTTNSFSGEITAGDLLLLPKGSSHRYRADTRQPWTIYWMHFAGLQSERLLEDLDYTPEQPVVQLGLQPSFMADFKRLLSLRHSGYSHNIFIYGASLVRQMLCYLSLEVKNTTAITRHNFNLDAIHGLMLANLSSSLDLDTLAASVNLSKYHFATKYKQLTGYSPIRHFIHMKMERACEMLDSSQLSISEISSKLGYDDPLYFSRQFRKTVGSSPTLYRKQNKG
ncbi:helix-turn-helix domain-containing protein [Spongorhabdus nitratireducens]